MKDSCLTAGVFHFEGVPKGQIPRYACLEFPPFEASSSGTKPAPPQIPVPFPAQAATFLRGQAGFGPFPDPGQWIYREEKLYLYLLKLKTLEIYG